MKKKRSSVSLQSAWASVLIITWKKNPWETSAHPERCGKTVGIGERSLQQASCVPNRGVNLLPDTEKRLENSTWFHWCFTHCRPNQMHICALKKKMISQFPKSPKWRLLFCCWVWKIFNLKWCETGKKRSWKQQMFGVWFIFFCLTEWLDEIQPQTSKKQRRSTRFNDYFHSRLIVFLINWWVLWEMFPYNCRWLFTD